MGARRKRAAAARGSAAASEPKILEAVREGPKEPKARSRFRGTFFPDGVEVPSTASEVPFFGWGVVLHRFGMFFRERGHYLLWGEELGN